MSAAGVIAARKHHVWYIPCLYMSLYSSKSWQTVIRTDAHTHTREKHNKTVEKKKKESAINTAILK